MYGNLAIQEFSSKWVMVMLPYRGGGRAACSGGWGILMTHSDGLVTIQIIAFKYVMASVNHTDTTDIKNRSWQVCHTLRFYCFKTLIALKIKCFLNLA
jgi:hypothetical protein